jgi:deoxyribonuclease-4
MGSELFGTQPDWIIDKSTIITKSNSACLVQELVKRDIHCLYFSIGLVRKGKWYGLPRIGVHVSIAGAIFKAVDRALERNCDTFQIFTRNPRGWRLKPITEEAASIFVDKVRKTGIDPVVAHMPYLPNLASPWRTIYKKSLDALITELERCGRLKIPFLVTHLGSHTGRGYETGLKSMLNALDTALSKVDNETMLLLENTAGTKNSMCSTFEEIQMIVNGIEHHGNRVGVCFDTCHAFAAGYDLRDEDAVQETIDKLDQLIGINRVRIIHANDSKGDLKSKLDRHEHIGLGRIGKVGFKALVHNKNLRELPFIMETPMDEIRDDFENIRILRQLAIEDAA